MARSGNNEIKTTLRLDGEKEYQQALNSANRHLRTLRSELKAETAELGANATAQQKAQAKVQNLQKQIAEQEKVVETLRKALAEAKEQYGDNEEVVAKWEQRLNNARATLANMQNDLQTTGNDFQQLGSDIAQSGEAGVVAAKSFADTIKDIAGVGESVSGAIENIFTGMVSTVRDVLTDLWDMIADTAARANNWTDIAGYWNTDPVAIQNWNRALEATANDFGDLQNIVSRLVLGGKEDLITEMTGVSRANFEDDWAYAMAVMDAVYAKIEEGQDMQPFYEQVFGERRATGVMDIINDWGAIRRELSEDFDADNGGYGETSDQLETMDALWVQMSRVETKWNALKDMFAAGFGEITADLLINVEGSLDAFKDFMNADSDEERQQALEDLRRNIEEFFQKVADAIRVGLEVVGQVAETFQGSDDQIVKSIGNIMMAFRDALEWLVEHQEAVVIALKAIFGVWLVAKLTAIGGKLASIVASIETIKLFSGMGGASAGANGVAAAAGNGAAAAGAGAAGAGAAGAGAGAMAGTALSQALWTMGPLAATAGVLYGVKLYEDNQLAQSAADIREDVARLEALPITSDEFANRLAWAQAAEVAMTSGERGFLGVGHNNLEATDQTLRDLEGQITEDMVSEWTWKRYMAYMHGINPEEYGPVYDSYGDEMYHEAGDTEQLVRDIIAEMATYYETANAEDQTTNFELVDAAVERAIRTIIDPDNMFRGGVTSEDVNSLNGVLGSLPRAITNGMGNIRVYMDGVEVGHLVAPTVSRDIGQSIQTYGGF